MGDFKKSDLINGDILIINGQRYVVVKNLGDYEKFDVWYCLSNTGWWIDPNDFEDDMSSRRYPYSIITSVMRVTHRIEYSGFQEKGLKYKVVYERKEKIM